MTLTSEEAAMLWDACIRYIEPQGGAMDVRLLGDTIREIKLAHEPKSIWYCEEHGSNRRAEMPKDKHCLRLIIYNTYGKPTENYVPCSFVEYIPKDSR